MKQNAENKHRYWDPKSAGSINSLHTPPFSWIFCLGPIPDKVDPILSTKQQIKNDAHFDFDGFSPVQGKVDPFCCTKQQID